MHTVSTHTQKLTNSIIIKRNQKGKKDDFRAEVHSGADEKDSKSSI